MDGKDNELEFPEKSNNEQPPKKQSEKHARFSVANVINPSSKGNAAETIRFSNEKQDDEVRLIGFFTYYVIPLNYSLLRNGIILNGIVYLFCIIVVSNSIS